MKIKYIRFLLIFLVVIVSFSFCQNFHNNGDDKEKNRFLIQLLFSTLENYHFEPKEINDEFSKNVFKGYLETSDYNKRILLKSDIEELRKYETSIDEEIKNSTYNFFDLSYKILQKRLAEVESYYTTILEKPFDFTIKESFETDSEKRLYSANTEELKEVWRKMLKSQTLFRLNTAIEKQEKAKEKSDTVSIKSISELEIKARKGLLKTYNQWFKRINELEKKDRLNFYLNSIAGIYDPHTSYFPPKDKENFDISMSGTLEGIGATLQASEGYIKIVNIVSGSPSWKQGDLEVGDLITKVAQGEKEAVDVFDMRLDNAVQLIRGKKGTEVRLTVKKKDGSFKVIPIVRDVIVLEETYAKSCIVKDKKEQLKIAYIDLPKFYVDFKDAKNRRCSDDIGIEKN